MIYLIAIITVIASIFGYISRETCARCGKREWTREMDAFEMTVGSDCEIHYFHKHPCVFHL